MNVNIFKAIVAIYPNIVTTNGDVAYDKDGNEVSYDLTAVQSYLDSIKYKDQRAAEYPSIADQLDLIYHEGIDAWKEQINTIKEKYPKG